MHAAEIVKAIEAAGATIAARNDKLIVAPLSVVPPAVVGQIKASKPALLDYLKQQQAPNGPGPVSDYTAAAVTALATGQPRPSLPLPEALRSVILLASTLEQWDTDTLAEAELFARRQLAHQECTADELAACYRAHLQRRHPDHLEQLP